MRGRFDLISGSFTCLDRARASASWRPAVSEQSGVFVLQDDGSLISMPPAQFAAEIDFQRLLARFPSLLAGDQIDPQSPRRWVLVKREQTITTSEIGASQWSI